MGVHPDLRADRDLAAAHHQPGALGVGRSRRRGRARYCSAAPAFRPWACRSRSTPRGRCWRAPNHVFAGYWEQPDESAAALDGGWFHTGDGGYLDRRLPGDLGPQEGRHHHRGENVSSIEVEDCLYQHAAVAEVAVIGVPDEKWGETIKALVVVREGRDGHRGRAHHPLPRPAGPFQGAHQRGAAQRAGPHRDGEAAEVQVAPALLGGAREVDRLGQGTGQRGTKPTMPARVSIDVSQLSMSRRDSAATMC